ncbi:MAG: hypothetical protein IPK79_13920 [Vampirovibrionales bacterium]|nr:hypothetical protein [Vampirovibrionales bacterium]
MADTTREHMLESIIVDLCEAELTWYEIQERTGLSEERAKEMAKVIADVFKRYFREWLLILNHETQPYLPNCSDLRGRKRIKGYALHKA